MEARRIIHLAKELQQRCLQARTGAWSAASKNARAVTKWWAASASGLARWTHPKLVELSQDYTLVCAENQDLKARLAADQSADQSAIVSLALGLGCIVDFCLQRSVLPTGQRIAIWGHLVVCERLACAWLSLTADDQHGTAQPLPVEYSTVAAEYVKTSPTVSRPFSRQLPWMNEVSAIGASPTCVDDVR
jgi:hypothetical protein